MRYSAFVLTNFTSKWKALSVKSLFTMAVIYAILMNSAIASSGNEKDNLFEGDLIHSPSPVLGRISLSPEQNAPFNFLDFPGELTENVINLLTIDDTVSLLKTCKAYREAVRKTRTWLIMEFNNFIPEQNITIGDAFSGKKSLTNYMVALHLADFREALRHLDVACAFGDPKAGHIKFTLLSCGKLLGHSAWLGPENHGIVPDSAAACRFIEAWFAKKSLKATEIMRDVLVSNGFGYPTNRQNARNINEQLIKLKSREALHYKRKCFEKSANHPNGRFAYDYEDNVQAWQDLTDILAEQGDLSALGDKIKYSLSGEKGFAKNADLAFSLINRFLLALSEADKKNVLFEWHYEQSALNMRIAFLEQQASLGRDQAIQLIDNWLIGMRATKPKHDAETMKMCRGFEFLELINGWNGHKIDIPQAVELIPSVMSFQCLAEGWLALVFEPGTYTCRKTIEGRMDELWSQHRILYSIEAYVNHKTAKTCAAAYLLAQKMGYFPKDIR